MEIIVNAKHIKHKLITNIGHKKKEYWAYVFSP